MRSSSFLRAHIAAILPLALAAGLSVVAAGCGDSNGGDGNAGAGADAKAGTGVGTDVTAGGGTDAAAGNDTNPAGDAGSGGSDNGGTGTDGTATGDDAADSTVGADAGDGSGDDSAGCGGKIGCVCTADADCTEGKCLDGKSADGKDGKFCTKPCEKTTPPDEVCDGVDNDCNGKTDENTCDDKNPCTADKCGATAPAAKDEKCEHKPQDGACDDGTACTSGDACKDGVCVGAKVDCDDQNPCTTDACDMAAGCTKTANTEKCDDKSACTTDDACADGKCTGKAVGCDDKNACTDDSCDPTKGCVNAAKDGPCDDGDACTTGDACTGGKCGATGVVTCNDKNPCTTDACDPAKGCTATDNTDKCDDLNACTEGDVCAAGKCAGAGTKVCDDGNPCTKDSCDIAAGCTATNSDGATCDDSSACTKNDVCAGGKCGGETVTCDDKNPCTADKCDIATGCTATADDNLACSDGSACTDGDKCAAGNCAAGKNVTCNDNNPCTDDSCDPAKGCVALANAATCDDGDACTSGDTCKDSKCAAGDKTKCDDLNPCTDDSCDSAKGCQTAPNKGSCSDGDACTTGDACDGGKCVTTGKKDCNDSNACTDDTCDPVNACLNSANTVTCDDGDPCTTGDACASGKCAAGAKANCDDNNPCTTDSCDPVKGCIAVANTLACDDGDACTSGDKCAASACVPGAKVNCNDNNACTDDSCDAKTGCGHVNNLSACDDGDACTAKDACDSGKCVSGAAVNCDDSNLCTDEVCDKVAGCKYTNNTKACNDNNDCTNNDVCAAGKCSGVGQQCDDKNPCTTDTCSIAGGCKYTNNTAACSDNNPCTTGDICAAGKCTSGAATVCNDNNGCTVDSCDPTKGCVTAPVPACVGLPFAATFTCGSAGANLWKLDPAPVAKAAAWAIDGTANPPGYWSPDCSLNFNNGVDFACAATQTAAVGSAVSPLFDATTLKAGTPLRLVFRLAGAWEANTFDNLDLDYSVDGAKTWTNIKSYDAPPGWNGVTVDVPAAVIGKLFQIRFRFNSTDCIANGGAGAFIDDFAVVAGCAANADCTDLNPCTNDTCTAGKCTYANVANGGQCGDGNACTQNDACNAGVCTPGAALVCNDSKVCTTDTCSPQTGCVFTNNTIACTDNNACTVNDACAAGACVPGPAADCNDNKPCTSDSCASATGCVNANIPSSVAACDGTPFNNYCYKATKVTGTWQAAESACVAWGGHLTSINSPAESGSVTNTAVGVCGNTGAAWIGLTDAAVEGTYVWTDGTAYSFKNWNANEPSNGGPGGNEDYVQLLLPGGAWNDYTAAGTSTCYVCKRPLPVACQDGSACTTNDVCDGKGTCVGGAAPNCNDNNVCTNDSCDPKTGCVNAANTAACTDNNACTNGDVCANKACVAGPALNCDDKLECTTDSCVPATGCVNQVKADSGPACDGSVVGGRCYKAIKTTVTWQAAENACVAWGGHLTALSSAAEQTAAFNQGVAVCGSVGGYWIGLTDAAVEGKYVWTDGTVFGYANWSAGEPNNLNNEDYGMGYLDTGKWNDSNGTATNICYVCEKADPPACNDGNACTTVDKCAASGKCVGTVPPNCDDSNPCTNDACDATAGCTHTNNTLDCTDNNACTVNDKCAAGKCVSGAALVCDDKTVCTVDTCDPTKGCVYTPDAANNVGALPCDGVVVGNRCYKAFKQTLTATAAETACVNWGGGAHLASAATATENAVIRTAADRVVGSSAVHIGLTDATTEGTYVWLDGTKFGYANWAAGQPNNGGPGGNADYVQMLINGTWDDLGNVAAEGYVCERPAPPKCETGGACNNSYCDAGGKCVTTALHNDCTVGYAMAAACNASVGKVCAAGADPYCCTVGWDSKCVNEVLTVAQDNVCVPACVHDLCTAAATGPLTAGCDKGGTSPGCVSQVCASDPYCCTTAWDGVCIGETGSICKDQGCKLGTCSHSACTAGAAMVKGCDGVANGNCVTAICNADAYCCTTSWDAKCVGEVATICKQACYTK